MQEQKLTDLYPYLAKQKRDLMVDFKVAQRLHLSKEALIELVREGLGPGPQPGFAPDHYWFPKIHVPSWKSWPRSASDNDVIRAADIILKDDRTRRIREFEPYDDEDPRWFLTTVFSRKAR